MFWKSWSWSARILSLVTLCCVGGLGFLAFTTWNRIRESAHYGGCQSNLKQMGLGFMQYVQDNDGKLPLVVSGGATYGWADAIQPYLRTTQSYQCPQERSAGQSVPSRNNYTDYPFNARLGGLTLEKIAHPQRRILSLDGNDDTSLTNARYALANIPPSWLVDSDSPLHRHESSANVLFLDGHVKAVTPAQSVPGKGLKF